MENEREPVEGPAPGFDRLESKVLDMVSSVDAEHEADRNGTLTKPKGELNRC